ncbi:MAG: DNA primase DnaG [Candidatus Micrarchaeota archaeon]|nr:DNA primase DnaG [Candidatus Micrarchaeota archaeon]
MGKTYIDTVKYMIKSRFEVDGMIEKPDIVGAVFGQTEGLLGDELDLRELQKNGRIGRIEVDTQTRGGRTYGTIQVPSSLDMVETSILAAALEVVDRVGPCEAKLRVDRIEDSRALKRKQVLERAKNLLKTMLIEEIPESKELSELVRGEVKIAEIETYGEDRLPAGPEVASSDAVIVVEGRADVINLLRNGIKNVVAVGGASVGKTVTELGREKEITVFLDGDRGGDIILRELMNATDVDYVSRAPTGKEVEELTRKELIKCLRSRVPTEQAEAELARGGDRGARRMFQRERPAYDSPAAQGEPQGMQAPFARRVPRPIEPAPMKEEAIESPEEKAKAESLRGALKELEGSLKARFFDEGMNPLGEAPIRDIMAKLTELSSANAIVLDGIVTQRLIDLAEQKGAKYIAGIRSGTIARRPVGLKMVLAQ